MEATSHAMDKRMRGLGGTTLPPKPIDMEVQPAGSTTANARAATTTAAAAAAAAAAGYGSDGLKSKVLAQTQFPTQHQLCNLKLHTTVLNLCP